MITKHIDIEISENNIFENDKLNRKQSIINLSEFIINTKQPLSLALNAKWGNGKTTFIRLWREYLLREKQINSIYFNAWKYDYSNEPLIVLLGEINQYIENNNVNNNQIKEKLENTKNIAVKIIKKSLPAFVNGATAGMLDLDKGFESAIGALSENSIKTLIDEYSKEKELIDSFKESIKVLFETIYSDKPFIIFIDELDRCKPLFSIQLLERIKHLFEIDNLIFVFSIDKAQLIESIKSQYGNIDGENYLKRFFDLEYILPEPDKDKFCEYLSNFYEWNKLFDKKQISEFYHKINHIEMIKYLSKSLDLSLREIERIYSYTDLVYKTLPNRAYEILLRMVMFFVTIKVKNEQYYLDLINKQKPIEYFLDILIDENIKTIYNSTPNIVIFIKAFIYSTIKDDLELRKFIDSHKENENEEIRQLAEILDYSIDYQHNIKYFIPLVIENIYFARNFNI